MTEDLQSRVSAVNDATLTQLVQAALQDRAFQITHWQVESLKSDGDCD
jgi:hypothetical protein